MRKKIIIQDPEEVYEATVVKSGNGAAIKSKKKHLGKLATVIIKRGKI